MTKMSWNEPIVKIMPQGLVVVKGGYNAIHRINHYPVDSVVCFGNTYPLDSDLFGGYHYPPLEQLGPDY